MSNVLQTLLNNGQVTLFADYRRGDLRDLGPLQRHGTIAGTDVRFSPQGAHFTGTGRIVHPDHVAGRNTTGSIVVLAKTVGKGATWQDMFGARDAGGTRIVFYHNTNIALYDGTTIRTLAGTLIGHSCVAINYTAGVIPALYINGVSGGNFSGVLTPTANDAAITVGAAYDGTNGCSFPIAAVLETNRPLDANEHAAVFAELQNRAWPARPYCVVAPKYLVTSNRRGLVGSWDPGATDRGICPDLSDTGATGTVTGTGNLWVEDSPLGKVVRVAGVKAIECGTYTAVKNVAAVTIAAWVKRTAITTGGFPVGFFSSTLQRLGIGATGTDWYWMVATGANSYGAYTLNDTLWHHFVLRYDGTQADNATRLRGWVDGVEVTLAYTSTIPAVTSSVGSNWSIGCTSAISGLGNTLGSGGPCAVWNRALDPAEIVQEFRRARAAGFKSDWGTPVSTAARGGVVGTELETTGWRFSDTTGRWWVDTSMVQGQVIKTLRCSTGGAVYQATATTGQSTAEAAFGAWEFSFYKGADGNAMSLMLAAATTGVLGDGVLNGYCFYVSNGEVVNVNRVTAGNPVSVVLTTGATLISNTTWYRARVTRDFFGNWSMRLRPAGGAWSAAYNSSSPDLVYTTSLYRSIDIDAGDMISLGGVNGGAAINKFMTI
jgi:hypothetical protein